jgi:hypothetical protein
LRDATVLVSQHQSLSLRSSKAAKYSFDVCRFLQRHRLRVMAVADHWQVTPQLFEKMDELCSLLLSQKSYLQFKFESSLTELRFPILCDKHHGRR